MRNVVAAVKNVVMLESQCCSGEQRHECFRMVFSNRDFYLKLLFAGNAADILTKFFALFEHTESSVHLPYSEMVVIIQELHGWLMKCKSYQSKEGNELPSLQAVSHE